MRDFEIINSFPSDFIFGTATSSYQIEGQKYGKCGLSNWDTFANKPGKIFKGQNGKIACSHILNYLDDLDLVKNGGFSAYRFSFSWPRLFPHDNGKVNPEGIDFYNRLLDGLLERNLQPFATLYHWDLPKYLDVQYTCCCWMSWQMPSGKANISCIPQASTTRKPRRTAGTKSMSES